MSHGSRLSHTTADLTQTFSFNTNYKWKISKQLSPTTAPWPKPNPIAGLRIEGIDREVDSVEVQTGSFYTGEVKYETVMETDCKETTKMTGTLPTSGLFDDLDLLQKSWEEVESFEKTSPDDIKCPHGLFDDLKKSSSVTLPLESLLDLGESSSSMDNPFFEEFLDLDHLFPELPMVDSLKLGFEEENAFSVVPSDICQSDVVTVETHCSSEFTEAGSPCSEIIDVATLESDSEVSSPGVSVPDVALSPESIIDVDTVENDSVCDDTVTVLNIDQDQSTAQPVTEEIMVIQTSDPLTLLTQDLPDPSSLPDVSEFTPSTLTVDLDELFSLSSCLGLPGDAVAASVGAGTAAGPSEVAANEKPQPKRKRAGSSESSCTSAKKAKHGEVDSCLEELDKRTVRRLKNNIASKHARAARKLKEQELFQKEEELEKSNAELRKQLEDLTLLTTSLRKVLVEKLSGVTCPV